jgi:hypothetical protein
MAVASFRENTMERAIVVRGNVSDPTHIELDEPIVELSGRPVEVVVRAVREGAASSQYQSTSPEAWEQAFHAWVDGHDRSTPLLSPSSLRREAMYDDRT